jgi:hypothetical protein
MIVECVVFNSINTRIISAQHLGNEYPIKVWDRNGNLLFEFNLINFNILG